jgi:hypothetical protein
MPARRCLARRSRSEPQVLGGGYAYYHYALQVQQASNDEPAWINYVCVIDAVCAGCGAVMKFVCRPCCGGGKAVVRAPHTVWLLLCGLYDVCVCVCVCLCICIWGICMFEQTKSSFSQFNTFFSFLSSSRSPCDITLMPNRVLTGA